MLIPVCIELLFEFNIFNIILQKIILIIIFISLFGCDIVCNIQKLHYFEYLLPIINFDLMIKNT